MMVMKWVIVRAIPNAAKYALFWTRIFGMMIFGILHQLLEMAAAAVIYWEGGLGSFGDDFEGELILDRHEFSGRNILAPLARVIGETGVEDKEVEETQTFQGVRVIGKRQQGEPRRRVYTRSTHGTGTTWT